MCNKCCLIFTVNIKQVKMEPVEIHGLMTAFCFAEHTHKHTLLNSSLVHLQKHLQCVTHRMHLRNSLIHVKGSVGVRTYVFVDF